MSKSMCPKSMRAALAALIGLSALAAAPAYAGWSQSVEFGPDVYYYHYTEPEFAHLLGAFYGADAAYAITYDEMSLRFEGRGAGGSLKYDGSGTSSGNRNYTAEARAILEREFPVDDTWSVTPFTGFGFRYLFDNQAAIVTTTGAPGYDRESHYYYFPVGVKFPVTVSPGWRVVPSFEYDFIYRGYQYTYLTNLPGYSNDLANSQNSGHAFRVSLTVEAETPIGEVKVGPYLRYWSIGASNTQNFSYFGAPGYGYEPGNHTVEAGAALVYVFKY
jgi:hypothetical protein